MAEQNIQNQDDLAGFEDYLAEFDSILNFDSESCPVCGIKVSDNLSIGQLRFVQYKILYIESEVFDCTRDLENKGIPFKVTKRLDAEMIEQINYCFEVMIPLKYLQLLQNHIID
jgi:hypothetical protein